MHFELSSSGLSNLKQSELQALIESEQTENDEYPRVSENEVSLILNNLLEHG